MSNRGFEKAEHTIAYAKYRPSYPLDLIERIMSFVRERDSGPYTLAVDVGCGNGQATRLFSKYFDQINGYDISEEQIKQAKKLEEGSNMKFTVSPCESLPLEDNSVNLITAATCMHWFDVDKFLAECKRVLKQNGVLATFSYMIPKVIYKDKSQILSDKIFNLYLKFRHYFADVLEIVEKKYEKVEFPFEEIKRSSDFTINCDWTLEELLSYIETWGLIQRHKSLQPERTDFEDFCTEMKQIVGEQNSDFIKLQVRFELFLVLCRK